MSRSFRQLLWVAGTLGTLLTVGMVVLIGDSWLVGARADRLHSNLRVGMQVPEALRLLDEGGTRVVADPACRTDPASEACTTAGVELQSLLFTVMTFNVRFSGGQVTTIGPVTAW